MVNHITDWRRSGETYIYLLHCFFYIWHLVDALLPHTLFLQWVERWLLRQSCLTPRLLIFLQVIMPRPRGRGRGRGHPVLTNDVRQPEVVFWNICIANTRVHTLPHFVILCFECGGRILWITRLYWLLIVHTSTSTNSVIYEITESGHQPRYATWLLQCTQYLGFVFCIGIVILCWNCGEWCDVCTGFRILIMLRNVLFLTWLFCKCDIWCELTMYSFYITRLDGPLSGMVIR